MENPYITNISVSKLRKEVIAREDKKYKTFEKILEICYQKIIHTNKTSSEYCCTFICPNMIFGLPLFNLVECIQYLMEKLFEKGFEVHLAIPNKLFISWKPNSEQNIEYCKQLYLTSGPATKQPHLQLEYNKPKNNMDSSNNNSKIKTEKKYRPIDDYTHTSTSIYDNDDMNLFSHKLSNLFTQ